MPTTTLRLTGITLVATGFLSLIAGTSPAAAAPGIGSSGYLSITDGNGQRAAVTLTCDPDGGSHPRAADACASLADVDGDYTALAARSGSCTLEYNPVHVRAQGLWASSYRVYEETFANQCVANLQTGGVVFDF